MSLEATAAALSAFCTCRNAAALRLRPGAAPGRSASVLCSLIIRMHLFIAIVLGAVCVAARANPLSVPAPNGAPVYIASEHLVVSVSPTNASLVGTFTFAVPAGRGDKKINGLLAVPVWLPATGLSREIEDPLQNMSRRAAATTASEDGKRLKRALAFNVRAPSESVSVIGADLFNFFRPRDAHKAAGFQTVLFTLEFRPGTISGESHPVTVCYNQPSLRTPTGGRFYYMPIFGSLPASVSTADTSHYSIIVRAEAGCALAVTNGAQVRIVHSGESFLCSPSHLQPIQGIAWPDANPQGGANGRQPFRSGTNQTSAAAASRRSP